MKILFAPALALSLATTAPALARQLPVMVHNTCASEVRILIRHKPENAASWKNSAWFTFQPGKKQRLFGVYHSPEHTLYISAEGITPQPPIPGGTTMYEGQTYPLWVAANPAPQAQGDILLPLTCPTK